MPNEHYPDGNKIRSVNINQEARVALERLDPEERSAAIRGGARRLRAIRDSAAGSYRSLRAELNGGDENPELRGWESDLAGMPDGTISFDEFRKFACRLARIPYDAPNAKTSAEGMLAVLRANGYVTVTGDPRSGLQICKTGKRDLPSPKTTPHVKWNPDTVTPTPEQRLDRLERRVAALEQKQGI